MKCSAEYIEEKIKATPDGGVCSLASGEYYIERCISIAERRNITLDGNGSVIISRYNNGSSELPTCDTFHIMGCKGLKLCNFVFETDTPVNMTGVVESINPANNSYILSVLPEFKTTGKEIFMMQNSCDREGSFDKKPEYYCNDLDKSKVSVLAGEILLSSIYTGCKYEYLGNNRFNVFMPENAVRCLNIGQSICVRHSAYGPVSVLIKNSDDTSLENITVHSAGGMGIVVLPRSENLYLDGFNVVLPENTGRLMSCNCNGIHIKGLSGRLTMKNCDFSGLGDDALNIHSTAATVASVDKENSTLICNYRKKRPDGLLPSDWCRSGDVITVLDSETCKKIGEFRVKSFKKDLLCFENLSGELKCGSILQNTAFSAAVEIKNCRVRNTRARAFVLQTENIEISGCDFYGMSLPAIQAAPDVRRWYEVGLVKNMKIHGNTFEKCGFINGNCPVITVQDNHDRLASGAPEVHENIEITNNVFKGSVGRCIFLTSVNGVKIGGNTFTDCNSGEHFIEYPVCDNVEIADAEFGERKKLFCKKI